jgi:hypothetical protein
MKNYQQACDRHPFRAEELDALPSDPHWKQPIRRPGLCQRTARGFFGSNIDFLASAIVVIG